MFLLGNNTFPGLSQHVICSPFPGRDFISKKLHEFVFLIEKTADPGTWLGFCPPHHVDSMGNS